MWLRGGVFLACRGHISEVRPRGQITEGLRWFDLDDLVFQLYMPEQGSLSAVVAMTIFLRTSVVMHNFSFSPAL